MSIQLSDHFNYKRLLRFCFPPIMMMVFTSIYSVVDGFFVSNWTGKTPFAAVNLIYPFIMILGGVGFMLGTGGSALVAKTLGEGDRDRANRYFTMMVVATVAAGIVLSALGIVFLRPIAQALGATEEMLEDCVVYGRIILCFNTAFMLQNLFQTFLTAAQKPQLGLLCTVAAGLTNIVLDALFVAVFRWGIVGAAVATGLSQTIGGVLPLIYFLRPNDSLLRLRPTQMEFRALGKACGNGASEMMSNISGSLVSMLFNFQLMRLAGEDGVAAYGVLMYVNFIFLAIFIGYTIGTAPIISYHYGAENRDEVKNVLGKSLKLMALAGVAMLALAWLLATPLAAIFVGYDEGLMDMTRRAFHICSFMFLVAGVNIFGSSFFTALNNGVVSALISFLRGLVFQVLAVIFLPIVLKLDGVWLAVVVAELCAFLVTAAFLLGKRKKYGY